MPCLTYSRFYVLHTLQAVLRQLSSQDYASLRQVSRTVSKHTTQHVPYISMLLSENSSADQLQQWCQATSNMQHPSSIHVFLAGVISADLFDLAIQQLSQRNCPVTELHISASAGDKDNIAVCTATLQPLQHLLPHLHTLVIEGAAIRDLPNAIRSDLHHLAAEAATAKTWPLQNLTLDVFLK